MKITNFLQNLWYQRKPRHLVAFVLWPLSCIFQGISKCRKVYYQLKTKPKFDVPIIVVGNLTVGGTGKTPFVLALAQFLKNEGYEPGIVMRGYQGQFKGPSMAVLATSSPRAAGEEAVLLAQKTHCPVVIGRRRCVAVRTLLTAHPNVNVIISDDGLQHYAMPRDIEMVVVDELRLWGNGFCLPAGPLREPLKRLKTVDYVVPIQKKLSTQLISLNNTEPRSLSDFIGQKVHAVAGIGDPNLFFAQLREQGLKIIPHAFNDHHHYTADDLTFDDDYPILMTEKDAVKCYSFNHKNMWAVPLILDLPESLQHNLLQKLAQCAAPSISNKESPHPSSHTL